MSRGRRYLAVLVLAALLIPSLGMFVAPYETHSVEERRMLAPTPPAPRTLTDWLALPRAADAFFADHFAWRGPMVKAALRLDASAQMKPRGAFQAIRGRDDWLLLYPGLLGLTGGQTNPRAAERYGRFVCGLQADARARGATFLFAPAPGPVEIYPDAAPDWVQHGSPTQPDLVLQAARACGVEPLDLRPVLAAAKGMGRLYQHHDSHWTDLGALVAFDAMATRLGRPWNEDPKVLPWRQEKRTDSDLIRLSGEVGLEPEVVTSLIPPAGLSTVAGRVGDLDHGTYPPAFEVRPPGATTTVLIVGDSYSADFMPALFWRAGVALVWIHEAECGFDRRVLDRVRPDVVVLTPSSRLAACR